MPVWNAEQTVGAAIQSVLASDFPEFELIIVNDGSTDTTREVLGQIHDPRIRLLDRPHLGVAEAFNEAVRQSRGAYLARMDADDLMEPDRLGRQRNALMQLPLDVIGGQVQVEDASGGPVPSWQRYEAWVNRHLDPGSIAAYRFVESPLVHPTTMALRPIFEMGCREGDFPEDYEFWLRVLARGFRAGKLATRVLRWVDRPDRLTRTDSRYRREGFDRCRRGYLLSGPLRGESRVGFWGAGQTGKPWIRWLGEAGFRVDPLVEVSRKKHGHFIHGAVAGPPENLSPAGEFPLLVAVGAEGATGQILEYCQNLGYVPGRDLWFLA